MDTELTLSEGMEIHSDFDEEPTEIEIIDVEGNFDFVDDDFGPHFSRHKKLREFKVNEKCADKFFTQQGCLYLKLNDNKLSRGNIEEVSGDDLYKYDSGSVLVCCPQNNPIKDITLPSDCISITASAFDGCLLNSLTLPDSLKCGAYACFAGLKLKVLRVPNNAIDIGVDHNNVNEDVLIESNTGEKCSEDIERFWRMAVNENIWEAGDTKWWLKMINGCDIEYAINTAIDSSDMPF